MSERDETKRYWIEVRGFDGHMVVAKSAGAAKYANFKAWKEAGYGREHSFRDFLDCIETFQHHGRAHEPQAPV